MLNGRFMYICIHVHSQIKSEKTTTTILKRHSAFRLSDGKMKVLKVLQPHWLSYIYSVAIVVAVVADYASALQQSQPQPQPQPQSQPDAQTQRKPNKPTTLPQKQPQHAEVNNTTSDSLRFGSKIVDYPVAKVNSNNTAIGATHHQQHTNINKQQQQQQLQTGQHATNTANVESASRVARRYDAPNVAATQLVAQHDLPLVQKNRAASSTANASAAGVAAVPTVISRSKQQNISTRSNPRYSTSVAAATGQRSNSSGSQAQSARQSAAKGARNSNATSAASVPRQQTRRRDEKRSRVVSSSSVPAAGAGSRGNVNKSRKDVSATNTAISATTMKTTTSTLALALTSTSKPTSTTVRPVANVNSAPRNPFSFFVPSLWGLSSPPKPSSTRKPPKKYTPLPQIVTSTTPIKVKKNNNQKAKITTTTPKVSNEISTTTPAPKKSSTTEGPFRIALPTFNFFNIPAQRTNEPATEKDKRNTVRNLRNQFACPRESEVRFQLFPKICKNDEDCTVWNRDELCCEIFGAKSCVSGLAKPLEETSHTRLIPRKCPNRPLAELWWQVQECETDMDCWPRVCCPDGNKRYCRTSQPELETVPVSVKRSFDYLSEYLECTPAPPRIFDLHPKTCVSTLDCFPNVCCQEAGLRHCRPPKKSLLTFMANFLNVDFVKRLAQNIVIK